MLIRNQQVHKLRVGVLLRKCSPKGVGVQIKASKNNMGVQLEISRQKPTRPINLPIFSFIQLLRFLKNENLRTIRNLPYIMFLVAVI